MLTRLCFRGYYTISIVAMGARDAFPIPLSSYIYALKWSKQQSTFCSALLKLRPPIQSLSLALGDHYAYIQVNYAIIGLAYSYAYCLEQVCVWAFLHGIFLITAVLFPFNYRELRISGRIHYAHIISVVLDVIIPLPAALVHLEDGHIAFISPALLCRGRNGDYTYYTFILPVSIIMCITSYLLVVIIWTIFKVIIIINLDPVHIIIHTLFMYRSLS